MTLFTVTTTRKFFTVRMCVCVCVCVNDGLKAFSGVVSAAVPFVLRRKLLIHTSHSTQSP